MSTDLNVKEFRDAYGYNRRNQVEPIWRRFLKKLSFPNKKSFFSLFPILLWLPKYDYRKWLLSDLVSGFTVGMVQVPQGMAYASLAGVKPIYGLYTGFFPVLIYTIFGTSRHLSMGSYALTSLMIGAHLEGVLPLPTVNNHNNSTNLTVVVEEIYHKRILYVNAVAFFTSLFLIVFGIFRIGFLTKLFSRPFQSGFIFAISVLTILSVGKNLFGIQIQSYSGPLSMIWLLRDFFTTLFSLNDEELWHVVGNIVTSFLSILFLLIVKIINKRYKEKYFHNFLIPGEAIVIAVGTMTSYFLSLEKKHSVDVIGPIPKGLPAIQFPHVQHFSSVLLLSFLVAIIGYSVVVSLAQTFAEKGGYTVDPNQELFAFGFGNLFGSMFSCIPSFSAMSRSCIQFESGGKTQLVGWIASILMLFVLLYIGPFLQYLPKACLSSIVVVGVSGLLWKVTDVKRYWTNHKLDSITWLCTCLATLLLDVTLGMACGVAVLLICHLLKTSHVTPGRLARIADTDLYKEEGLYTKETTLGNNITLVQLQGPLNFYNFSILKKSLETLSEINPLLELTKFSNATKQTGVSAVYDHCELEGVSARDEDHHHRVIILDCSGITSIDSVGADGLMKIITSYKQIDVTFLLACCSDHMLLCLDVIDDITEISYVTVDGAVKAATKLGDIGALECDETEILSPDLRDISSNSFNQL